MFSFTKYIGTNNHTNSVQATDSDMSEYFDYSSSDGYTCIDFEIFFKLTTTIVAHGESYCAVDHNQQNTILIK